MGRISGTNLGLTMLALTAACGGSTPATTGGGGTTASATTGVGGTAQSTSSTTASVGGTGGAAQSSATATASVTASASGSGGSGGGDFGCNPVAEPGSIYEATVDMFGSAGLTTMCPYRGQVMLIVNTAAI